MKRTRKNSSIIDEEKLKAYLKLFFGKTIEEIAQEINEIYRKDPDYVLVAVKRKDYDWLKSYTKNNPIKVMVKVIGFIELKKLENLKNLKNP
jgi:hypothetical protein